jgi:hypothetical protein
MAFLALSRQYFFGDGGISSVPWLVALLCHSSFFARNLKFEVGDGGGGGHAMALGGRPG